MTQSSPAERSCAAVVVAYRSAGTLPSCLHGLIADPVIRHIVVVDNSGEAAAAAIVDRCAAEQRSPVIEYIDPGSNVGFAAACNIGIARSTDPVVALVNPDVRLIRSLEPLLELLAMSPGSLVAGGLIDDKGRITNVRNECTLGVELRRAMLGTPRAVPLTADGIVHDVDQVDGALLLVERRSVHDLGGLAETFPLYYEDVELCWRFRRAGHAVRIHAAVYGAHDAGTSSAQNPRVYEALRISRLRWLRLRYGRVGAVAGTLLSLLEVVSRSPARPRERAAARLRAVRTCAAELLAPGSQEPLGDR